MTSTVERKWPIVVSAVITVVSAFMCLNGCWIIQEFYKNLMSQDNLSLAITLEGILFASLLTFLGLFMQLRNSVMEFVKRNKSTYRRLISYIKWPIVVSSIHTICMFVIKCLDLSDMQHSAVLLLSATMVFLMSFSICLSARLIYVYFCVVSDSR